MRDMAALSGLGIAAVKEALRRFHVTKRLETSREPREAIDGSWRKVPVYRIIKEA